MNYAIGIVVGMAGALFMAVVLDIQQTQIEIERGFMEFSGKTYVIRPATVTVTEARD